MNFRCDTAASCARCRATYHARVKKLSCLLFIVAQSAAWGATPPLSVTADFAGDGKKQTCTLEVEQISDDLLFHNPMLKVGKETLPLGEDFYGFSRELRAYTVSGDSKKQVLVASAIGESDFIVRFIFTMAGGKLKQVGRIEGQGDIKIPGNGSIVSTSWMGFWSKTEKHVFGPDLMLARVPQEFYSVDVEGTVLKGFPVYQTRSGKALLANTREGSKFKVLLWDPASLKKEGDQENTEDQWYLIRTESGFTGWVQTRQLMGDSTQLPWAG
jgi:hypothetical protein